MPIVNVVVSIALVASVLWMSGALYFDVGRRSGFGWLLVLSWWLVCAGLLLLVSPVLVAQAQILGLFGVFLVWWFTQQPTNEGDWDPCYAVPAKFERQDDQIHVQNLRFARYPQPEEFEVQYLDRTFNLSELQAVDALITFWGSNWICHPMAIFNFGTGGNICFSIEVRYRVGDTYGVLPGIYRQHELMYVVCDERDAILRRVRYHTMPIDCYLYRLNADADFARGLLEEYIDATNRIAVEPQWYNAVTSNCTTEIFENRREKVPWDWRMLINGQFDKMLYDKGLLCNQLSFDDLKQRSRINDAVRTASFDSFSEDIRRDLPDIC